MQKHNAKQNPLPSGMGNIKAEDCPKLNTCPKIVMVMDKDLAGDWQYAKAIRAVCQACTEEIKGGLVGESNRDNLH